MGSVIVAQLESTIVASHPTIVRILLVFITHYRRIKEK
jgi:hypothetical protein